MRQPRHLSKLLSLMMVLMLLVSVINITALAAPSGNSVDHIDIGVSLTADIMIDGKLYENQTYTLEKADLTSENLSITSSTGGHSYSLHNITTSSGSSGVRQYRISGNFPVGTKEAPVTYTVTLTKTVSVTTPTGDVTLPVTFAASFQYWDSHNDCPGLGRGWSSGGVSRGSGLDFVLGNAKTDVNTKGTISIQKTVSGLALAEGETKTFTFDVYAADGTLYDTISVTLDHTHTTGVASVSEVPFGTYYIVERDAAATGYTLVVAYAVGSNASADRSADIVLSAESPEGSAHVTNTYTEIPKETEPPVTEPPVTEPPVTEPPVTEPPVTEPPVTEPPVTEPPVTEPPVTEPPVTEPPTTEAPTTEPGGDMSDVPQTGSSLVLWIALAALSGSSLIVLNRKKD